jgi:large subunit ribosomal protein L17
MRHRVAHRKLGRVTEHRLALLRNQAENLLRHERIETTVPKAKEVKAFVEKLITVAKRGNAASVDGGQIAALNARRQVLRDIQDRDVVAKLFKELAPRYAGRPGGYTRLLRTGFRRGDAADLAQLELVGSEYSAKTAAEKKAAAAGKNQPKGLRGRLAATRERLMARRAVADAEAKDADAKEKNDE